ncbi:MAG: tetratricopeptide repeat protein [Candidatus Adiutrix sp.]|jgi:hypothetical protein|nr:tetratricopeptide repeat protein [Candidatus Adiutrix sp.]
MGASAVPIDFKLPALPAEYESCWAREDFSRAAALMERLLRRSPDDPEWRWYRAAALDRQGRWLEAEAEMAKAGPKNSPPGKTWKSRPADGPEALAELLDPPWRSELLFSLTLATASPELCEYFLERLGFARAPLLLRRLGAARPEAASAAAARVRDRLERGRTELERGLAALQARILALPGDLGPILRAVYLLQAWEDLLAAEAQLGGPETARPRALPAEIIAQAFAPIYEENYHRLDSGLALYSDLLRIIELGSGPAGPCGGSAGSF